MEHPEEQSFTLEDILREFSDRPQAVPAEKSPPEEDGRRDTIRLDEIQEAVANTPGVSGDTLEYAPVDEELPADDDSAGSVPTEPFSGDWEPEYEAPLWDEAPEQPPVATQEEKSRLRQMRREIVSGPEKRFHDLDEKGIGKLRLSGVLNTLLFLVMAGMTLCYHFGLLEPERLRLIVFIQLLGLLLSMLMGCYRLLDGLQDLVHLRFTPNALLLLTAVAMLVDGILCLQELRIGMAAVFVLEMSMAIWAASHQRATEMAQMDTLRRAARLQAVVCLPDYCEGMPGYRTAEGSISDFMDRYNKPSGPEKVLNWFALGVFAAAVAVGITAGILHGAGTGIRLGSATLLLGMPVSAFVSLTRPGALLEKRLHKLGSVLCGWEGIKAVEKKAVYPLTDSDLFPAGSVKLGGTKFFNEYNPDEVVAYTAALMKENGGALEEVFTRMLESRNGYRFTVEQFKRYSGGVGGSFGDVSVLVGTRQFLQDMGVEMSKGSHLQRAVYTAVDGTLAGVFALNYLKAKETGSGLNTLTSYKGLVPMVMTEDFMLTGQSLAARFKVNTRFMRFPAKEEYDPLLERKPEEGETVVSLSTRDNLAARAYTVTGARVLKSALRAGVVTHIVGGVLGIGVAVALTVTGVVSLLTPVNVLLYQLAWMIPGLLITEWTRSI